MGNRLALLIGVTEYGEGFEPITSPKEDVAIMNNVLGDPDIGDFKVTSLINPDLIKMRLAIEDHFDNCQKDDLVLFYYSGHGDRSIDGSLYFLSSDSRQKSSGQLKIASALETSFIHSIARDCMAEQQVFIVDCAFSGCFGTEAQKWGGEGRVILTSSRSFERSYGSKSSNLSVYTHHLAAGLQTEETDKQGKGYITVGDLHDYVKEKVEKENPCMTPSIFISNRVDKIIIAKTTQQAQIQIFLAHANEDKDEVMKLYERLEARGYKPWMDKKNLILGQNWREEIPKAISQSDIFIACLSQRFVSKSSFVQKELRLALQEYAKKPPGTIYLLPIKLDDCEIPDLKETQLGVKLRDLQWLNYWEPDSFDKLVEAIEYKPETFS